MSEELEPHDSEYVYSSTKGKHWFRIGSKIAQSERGDRSRAQWIILGLVVVFAVFGGSFLGFIIETQYLNPPVQVIGLCAPPAFVSGQDCVQKVCVTPAGGGTQTCNLQQAGELLGQNPVIRLPPGG